MITAAERARLAPDDGVFELPGTEPAWIWVHTCPKPKCSCRSALVLATTDGREALLERGAVVRAAWDAGAGYANAASKLEDVDVFQLDVDTAEVFAPSDEPLDLAKHPSVGTVVERLDGELLDAIGRLWYRGKGLPDPELRARGAAKLVVRGWQPGDMLAWNDVLTGVRHDFYVLEDLSRARLFEASEMYCPVPNCHCGEIIVDFETRTPRGAPPPGRVTVERSGATKSEPTKNGRDRLDRLWGAFQKRHPKYRERFARRYSVMKEIGARFAADAAPASPASVGRNAPCPCGSGKKFKRCCGRSAS